MEFGAFVPIVKLSAILLDASCESTEVLRGFGYRLKEKVRLLRVQTQANTTQRTPPKRPNTTVKFIRQEFETKRRECEGCKRTAAHGLVTMLDVKVYFTRDLWATSGLSRLRAEDGCE